MTFWGLSNGRVYGVFSVHTPCIFVSSSTVSNCLDQKPMARGPGWVEQRPRLTPAWPGLQSPQLHVTVVCWAGIDHLLALRQQDRMIQVIFFPNDQKTNSYHSETPWCQAYKNLCHRVDLIQDFSSCPNVGNKFLSKLYIAELFAIVA